MKVEFDLLEVLNNLRKDIADIKNKMSLVYEIQASQKAVEEDQIADETLIRNSRSPKPEGWEEFKKAILEGWGPMNAWSKFIVDKKTYRYDLMVGYAQVIKQGGEIIWRNL